MTGPTPFSSSATASASASSPSTSSGSTFSGSTSSAHEPAHDPVPAALTSEPKPFFGLDIPFMRILGLVPLSIDGDTAIARMPYDPRLGNSRGDFHGGALMGALDFMLSVPARAHDLQGVGVVTVEMNTHFIASARSDVTVRSRLIRRGGRIAFCEGEVVDADGMVLCVGRGVFRMVARDREGG